MPSKEAVLVSITKDRYSGAEVRHLINTITHIESERAAIEKLRFDLENKIEEVKSEKIPQYLKRGDVFTSKDSNGKSRPYVIIKVLKDTVVSIPMSTCCDELNLISGKSRFLGDSFFGTQLVTVKKETAIKRWAGIYDNEKLVRKAVRELREYSNKVLK